MLATMTTTRAASVPRANAARHCEVRAFPAARSTPTLAAAPALAAAASPASCRRRRVRRSSAPAAAAANGDANGEQRPASSDAAAAASSDGKDDGWFEGLSPEEDAEIPGGIAEAMSASTRLGKAIRSACDELDALAALEDEALQKADGLLQKLGVVKGSLFGQAGQAGKAAAAGEGGPRDALAALKRAAEEEAEAQAAHLRAMAARQEGQPPGGDGGAK
jgi:hypothetical protein